jgi:hypothetical protein
VKLAAVLCLLLVGCGTRVNPGAVFPVHHVPQSFIDAKWPYYAGSSGIYDRSAIYISKWPALPHEIAHLADDLGGDYWRALALVDAPGFRCGPHKTK